VAIVEEQDPIRKGLPNCPRLLKVRLMLAGITQAAVAAAMDVTPARVSQLLNGAPCRRATWQRLRAAVARVLLNREETSRGKRDTGRTS